MIYPGLKKLGNELNFKNNGTYVYGFINNTYVIFSDGKNQKNVSFRFPTNLDEDDKKKILSWQKKGYAKKIEFFTDQSFDVFMVFTEYFIPFNVSKIKEVIEDITNYIHQKYSDKKPKCCGDNCLSDYDLSIIDLEGIPFPMCSACVKKNRIFN